MKSTTLVNSSSESTQIAPIVGGHVIAQDALDEVQVAMQQRRALCAARSAT